MSELYCQRLHELPRSHAFEAWSSHPPESAPGLANSFFEESQ
jgi:hypothetical protein